MSKRKTIILFVILGLTSLTLKLFRDFSTSETASTTMEQAKGASDLEAKTEGLVRRNDVVAVGAKGSTDGNSETAVGPTPTPAVPATLLIEVMDTRGNPIVNVPVEVLRKIPLERAEDLITRSKTDAQGQLLVECDLPEVLVQVNGDVLGYSNGLDRVSLSPGKHVEHRCRLLEANASLLARFLTASGQPITNLEVSVNQGNDFAESGRSDEKGEARFRRLFPGIATISFKPGSMTEPKTAMAMTKAVELVEGENAVEFCEPRPGQLRISLRKVGDGSIEEEDELRMDFVVSMADDWQALCRGQVVPGTPVLLTVPAGKLQATGDLNRFDFRLAASSLSFEAGADRVVDLEFTAERADREVEVEVIGPDEKPLAGVDVFVLFQEEGDPLSESGSMETTDENGRCIITNLVDRPGRFHIDDFNLSERIDVANIGDPPTWRFEQLPQRRRLQLQRACSVQVEVIAEHPEQFELWIEPDPREPAGQLRLSLGRQPKLIHRLRAGTYEFSLVSNHVIIARKTVHIGLSVAPTQIAFEITK